MPEHEAWNGITHEDITATAAARLAGVNRKTANSYYNDIREKILRETVKETHMGCGEFEADGPYFGARRVRGKRGRGAAGKTPVFGLRSVAAVCS